MGSKDELAVQMISNNIDGPALLEMSKAKLIEMGVLSRNERKQILQWIEKLENGDNNDDDDDDEEAEKERELPVYELMAETFGGVNTDLDLEEPRNFSFWNKDNEVQERVAIKTYWSDDYD